MRKAVGGAKRCAPALLGALLRAAPKAARCPPWGFRGRWVLRAGLWCRVGGAQGVLGWWCGQVVVSLCSSPIPLVSLWLRVPPKGQDYPVGMSRSQNVLFTSITCPVVVLLPFSSSSFFSSVFLLHFFSSIFAFQYLFALACSVFPSVGALHAAFARTAATVPASASSARRGPCILLAYLGRLLLVFL